MATVHSKSKGRLSRSRPTKAGALGRFRARNKMSTRQRETATGRAAGEGAKIRAEQHSGESSSADGRAAVRIRGRLRDFLESEQGFLLKAESLLLCIAKSMDDSAHPSTGPYYPDVVELVSDLIGRRARNIDEMLLDGRLPAITGQ
jgi:hypothetical protein